MGSARDGSPDPLGTIDRICSPPLSVPPLHFPSTDVPSGRHLLRHSGVQPERRGATHLPGAGRDIQTIDPVYAVCISRHRRHSHRTGQR
jgi:hypothetical protein